MEHKNYLPVRGRSNVVSLLAWRFAQSGIEEKADVHQNVEITRNNDGKSDTSKEMRRR